MNEDTAVALAQVGQIVQELEARGFDTEDTPTLALAVVNMMVYNAMEKCR